MEYLIVFIFGAIIGSFLNVCIYRIPRNESIVGPRSYCPKCRKTIGWFDNVPFISFLSLRGRCRHCGEKISKRYFVVELVTALSAMLILRYYPLGSAFFVYWTLTCVLIVIVFIDLEFQEIPDCLSLQGIAVGLILMTVLRLDGSATTLGAFINSALGVVTGFGSMFLLALLGEVLFKKEALGGGDMKLMAMLGAFLGWKLILLTFFLAPVMGSGVGIFAKLKHREDVIAYGPYLALGAIISLLYGDAILGYFLI